MESRVQAGSSRTQAAIDLLPFEPLPSLRTSALLDDASLADNRGKRIGILIVTYNAVTTLTKVLKRITPDVWKNVEEIAVFDDASQDATYELAMGTQALRELPKLHVLSTSERTWVMAAIKRPATATLSTRASTSWCCFMATANTRRKFCRISTIPSSPDEADAVFGSRMMKTYGGPLKGGMPLYKYAGNRILTIFENRRAGNESDGVPQRISRLQPARVAEYRFHAYDR